MEHTFSGDKKTKKVFFGIMVTIVDDVCRLQTAHSVDQAGPDLHVFFLGCRNLQRSYNKEGVFIVRIYTWSGRVRDTRASTARKE